MRNPLRALLHGLTITAILCGGTASAMETTATADALTILECGESRTGDLSANWSPGAHRGEAWEFSDHCYLIRHGDRLFLWDAGIADGIAAKPEGLTVAGGLLTLRVPRTLASQLEELGIAPADVTDIAFSHFHADHVGNANLFTRATHYVQAREQAVAFGPDPAKSGYAPALYEALKDNPTVALDGDHDVFGDGSVVILSTPGHTPGHQSLLVRLRETGNIVLSGDMVHFHENWTERRVPARNFDRAQTLASMERIAALLGTERATLWINHDKAQSGTLPKAPMSLR
ncbi:MAG: N-acyl homoserine lactonase family protein [Burkholderiales bacterium]